MTVLSTAVPSSLFTSNIELNKATMNWNSVANADHYDIRMRVQGGTWSVFINNIPSSFTSKQKSNLQSSTSYEWSIRSACSSDSSSTSAWSSVQSFNTLTPCTTPINTLTSNITLSSATLGWDAVSGALGYQVRFKEDGTSWGSWIYDIVYVTTLSKTGLLSNTEYEWEVRSFCDSSMISVSAWEDEEFETLELCGTATNLSVPSNLIGVSTAQLKWKPAISDHFTVAFKDVLSATWDTLLLTGNTVTALTTLPLGVTATTVTQGSYRKLNLIGLTSGTTYDWQVMVSCNAGNLNNSSFVNGLNFTTNSAPCTTPINTLTSNITLSSATLGWNAVSGALGYIVRYKEVNQAWGTFTYDTVNTNSYSSSALSPGIAYHWQVNSVCDSNANNNSVFSSFVVFNTVNGCAKPNNIIVDSITTSSFALSWDTVSNAFDYRLIYYVVGSPWSTRIDTIITSNSHNITGLISNENYRWRIRTNCNSSSSYNSGWTAWDTLTTLSSIRITAGDTQLGKNLNVFPNPTRGLFNISFTAEKVNNFEITIIDAFGQIVSNEKRQDFVGEYTKKVDLSNWPRGIYMVQIKTKDSFVSKRIVLQ